MFLKSKSISRQSACPAFQADTVLCLNAQAGEWKSALFRSGSQYWIAFVCARGPATAEEIWCAFPVREGDVPFVLSSRMDLRDALRQGKDCGPAALTWTSECAVYRGIDFLHDLRFALPCPSVPSEWMPQDKVYVHASKTQAQAFVQDSTCWMDTRINPDVLEPNDLQMDVAHAA